ANGTLAANGGIIIVSKGGAITSATVQSGGVLQLYGAANAVTVQSAGTLSYGRAISANLVVSSGSLGAPASVGGVTLSSGAYLTLAGATVLSGATVSLASGAIATALTVSSGGAVVGPGFLGGVNVVAGLLSGVTLGRLGYYPGESADLLSGA